MPSLVEDIHVRMKQSSKDRYYLEITKTVGAKSTCLRRKYGAIIVKNDEIVATGYNGSPRGFVNCSTLGKCVRNECNVEKGKGYNLCTSVHAEMNCIISASRQEMIGSTLYIVGVNADGSIANPSPCLICHRLIINAGITRVVGGYQVNGKPDEMFASDITVNADTFGSRIYFEEYVPLFGSEENVPDGVKPIKINNTLPSFMSDIKEPSTAFPKLTHIADAHEVMRENRISEQKALEDAQNAQRQRNFQRLAEIDNPYAISMNDLSAREKDDLLEKEQERSKQPDSAYLD